MNIVRTMKTGVSVLLCVFASIAVQASDIVDTAVKAGSFKTLVAAVKAAGLVETLKGEGPFTVFAPTDEAFAKIPQETLESLLRPENRDKLRAILTYHVLPGEVLGANVVRLKNNARIKTVNGATLTLRNRHGLRINNANIVKTDVLTDNGVIHVIDSVLLPPGLMLTRSSRHAANRSSENDDIVDTAVKAGSFKTLVAAVKAAGLVETLKGEGPFTVFAPTDEAFAKIPQETLESLLRPENRDKLRAILTYHVLPGKVLAEDVLALSNNSRVRTVNGNRLTLRTRGMLRVNNANIVKTDILTGNGVIHVIDTVLIPPMPARVEEQKCPKNR